MKRISSPANGGRFILASIFAVSVVLIANLLGSPGAKAAVPNGFTNSLVTSISRPTDVAFTPGGTMLITAQGGALYKRSGGSTTLVLSIANKICSDFERGLLGVTVDPEYVTNNYIYLFYTVNKHGSCAYNQSYSPVNRVSRFIFNGTTATSEKVLIDNVPSPGGNHNAGGLTFGKDGYLYIAVGDGGCQIGAPGNCGGANANARSKHRLLGKVLRVDRDGNAPSSNPFYASGGTCRTTGVTTSGLHCKETYSWGLRNPFRIAADPNASGTRIFANDVGQNAYEEIDQLQAGADYGWNVCEGFAYNGGGGTCGFADTNPIHVYGHGGCNSITGGSFIPNGSWPSSYDGAYFFADYTCGTIWTLKNVGGTWTRTVFASGLGAVTEVEFGPDGANVALYYTNYGSSQVRKITYNAANNQAPEADIDASPTYGALPLEVEFDGRDSVDPDGDPLTYKWTFDNGTTSTSSHPTRTFTEKRKYKVTLTVSDGRGGTSIDTVTIDAGNTRPEVIFQSPEPENEYAVGETILLRGYGEDAEDGIIPTSKRTWEVFIHHDTHTHPYLGPVTGNNIEFQAPAPEDLLAATNSYLEIRLTVRDSGGLGKVGKMFIYPNKVDVTVGSNVPGMLVWVDGTPFTTPAVIQTWENNPLTVMAPDQIGPDDQPYIYANWSDGGPRTHDYDPPATDSSLTANFNVLSGTAFPAHADARMAESSPDSNYGLLTGLSVKGDSTSDYETVIRFKLSGVGDTVYRARLYLYSYEGTIDGPDVYETSPSWSETSVTWNTRPSAIGGRLQGYGPVAKRSWIAYDVAGAIDGDGYVAFVLKGTTSDAVSFYSRQNSTNQPRLVIWSSAPSGIVEPATPTPTTEASPVPTETPEPIATDTPAVPTATATELPPTEIPPTETLASPIPVDESFESDLTGWTGEGWALSPGTGSNGGQTLQLASSGSAEIPGSPSYVQKTLGTGETDLFLSLSIKPTLLDDAGTHLLTISDSNATVVTSVYALSDGTIGVRIGSSDSAVVAGSVAPADWSRIELRVRTGTGNTSVEVWVNDQWASITTSESVAVDLAGLTIGTWTTDATFTLLIDDVRVDRACDGSCPAQPVDEQTEVIESETATAEV